MNPDPRTPRTSDDLPLAAAERRGHPRRQVAVPATIAELDNHGLPGVHVVQELYDLSRSGAGLRGRRPIATGKQIVIILRLPGQPPKVLRAAVRNCRYLAHGLYHVGVEFLAPVSPEPLADWAAKL